MMNMVVTDAWERSDRDSSLMEHAPSPLARATEFHASDHRLPLIAVLDVRRLELQCLTQALSPAELVSKSEPMAASTTGGSLRRPTSRYRLSSSLSAGSRRTPRSWHGISNRWSASSRARRRSWSGTSRRRPMSSRCWPMECAVPFLPAPISISRSRQSSWLNRAEFSCRPTA